LHIHPDHHIPLVLVGGATGGATGVTGATGATGGATGAVTGATGVGGVVGGVGGGGFIGPILVGYAGQRVVVDLEVSRGVFPI